jgi:hypothetical protein
VYVNPVVLRDEVGYEDLGLKMRVGGNYLSVADKRKQSLSQGVPVYVNPTLMKDEMGNETLGLDMKVGHDRVSVAHKPNQALTQGIPVYVNPVVMKDDQADADLGLKLISGPDVIELAKNRQVVNPSTNQTTQALAQGIPVYVNPLLMKNEMAETRLDLNIKVGPDFLDLEKKVKK